MFFRSTALKQYLAYTDSPSTGRQCRQPFHHEFISDFHMDYDDTGLTIAASPLIIKEKITENAATQTTFPNLSQNYFRF